jgi:hypothetical protein
MVGLIRLYMVSLIPPPPSARVASCRGPNNAAADSAPNISAERRASGGVALGVCGFSPAGIKVVALNRLIACKSRAEHVTSRIGARNYRFR